MEKKKTKDLHQIFQKIILGNETAVEELYKNYKELVINIAFSIVKNRDLSEEIAQMVFLKIIKMDKSKLPTSNESSWIYTVTKNETIEYLRKQHNEIDIDDIYDIPNLKNEIDEIIDIDNFNTIIKCLDEKEKEIVSLKIISNFTFKEIAEILEIPIGTVQWKYYKAVHTLKIFISNLAMFVITFLIYIINSQTKNSFENMMEEDPVQDSIDMPSNQPGDIIIDSNISAGTKSESSLANSKELGLVSVCTIFLILTIIFGVIFVKFQQKKKKKTSK